MLLYENILSLCKQRGISITRLSVEIGVGNSAPTKWKRGAVPRMDTLEKIADYFGVSVSFLLSSHDSPDTFKMGNVSGSSAVAQGVTAGSITVHHFAPGDLSQTEVEVVELLRRLSPRQKSEALSFLFDMEPAR